MTSPTNNIIVNLKCTTIFILLVKSPCLVLEITGHITNNYLVNLDRMIGTLNLPYIYLIQLQPLGLINPSKYFIPQIPHEKTWQQNFSNYYVIES